MRNFLVVALATVAFSGSAFAQSAPGSSSEEPKNMEVSQAECTGLWDKARGGSDKVTQEQAKPYVNNFEAANPDGDTTLEQNEWMAACKKGLVSASASTGSATGESGSSAAGEKVHAPTNRVGKEVPQMKGPDKNSK